MAQPGHDASSSAVDLITDVAVLAETQLSHSISMLAGSRCSISEKTSPM